MALPSTHRWVYGGMAASALGRTLLGGGDDVMWCWDGDTGARVTNLYDANEQPVTEIPVTNSAWVKAGIPKTVTMPLFSVRDSAVRLPGNDADAIRNAILSLAPTDAQVASLIGTSSSTRTAADARYGAKATLDSTVTSLATTQADVTGIKAWRNLDIATIEPEFINRLELDLANVMQGIGRDPVTGDWYVTQTTTVGAAAGEASVIITHLNPAGRQLDSMELVNAGHGSTFVVQNVGSNVYIWITWAWGASAGTGARHELLRFQYRANATLTRDETTFITTLSKFDGTGGGYTLMSADWENDRIALRYNPTNSETFTLRKISDMLAGVNTPLGTVGPLSTVGATFQAYATVGGSLFVYRGASGGEAHTVTEYAWSNGAVLNTKTVTSLGDGVNAAPSDTYNEPEGMTAYKDPFTGRSTLYFGKTRGNSPPAINRRALVFGYVPLGNSKGFGMRLQALEDGGDTGWINLTLASGYKAATAALTPSYRVINGRVQFRGVVSPNTGTFTAGAGVTVATIPALLGLGPISLRPEMDGFWPAWSTGGAAAGVSLSIATGALIVTPATAAASVSLGAVSWLLG